MDSLADELADGVSSDACPESGGNKDWLRDDDNPGGPDCPNPKALSHVSVPNSPCVSTGKITQSSPLGQHRRKSTQRPGLVNSDEAEEVQPKAQRPKAVPYIGYLHTVIPPFRPGDKLGPPQVSYPSPSAMSLRDRSESLLRLEEAEKRRRDALLYRQPFIIRPTASQPLASSNASGSTNPRPPTSFIPVPSPERSPGRLVASGSGPGSGGRATRNADLGL
ncbi:hypothetical protein NUW58_g10506 [Xylaria curta]|uniref:Uncharacterized protein n=1 Tax=Xylaria curta TaxID=42375 RepID=A0ACC1MLP1_9PEZI|nr:hypothetical protein NUW58_g10506 [Xylaria curta]